MRMIDADALSRVVKLAWETSDSEDFEKSVFVAIATAPAIEPKRGEWEERKVSSEKVIDEWQSARCSVCGKYHTTPYMYFFDNYSFCPNCGSRMER